MFQRAALCVNKQHLVVSAETVYEGDKAPSNGLASRGVVDVLRRVFGANQAGCG